MTVLPLTTTPNRPVPHLRVSDLRQWTYCPRVAWWTYVCPVPKRASLKMRCGLAKERRLQQLQKRRSCRDFGFPPGTASLQANVPLMSTNLHLSGRLDLLLVRGNQRFPVEVKFSHGPARLNHRLQLAGYALLLEDLFGIPVPHGYIVRLPDETIDRVPIDQPLRDLALQTMQALRHMLLSEQMPPASPILARCADCEYRRFCGDVL